MKRYIHSNSVDDVRHVVIEVTIEYDDPGESPIAASEYKGFELPDGPLISGLPDAVADSQAIADYEAFIESVEDLIKDYYELKIYYRNSSSDHSHYFGMLAQDAEGNVLINFDFTLRLSNHRAHRSPQSKYNKKQKEQAPLQETGGRKTKPITRDIIVNKEEFSNYTDAYIAVDKEIEEVVSKMTR